MALFYAVGRVAVWGKLMDIDVKKWLKKSQNAYMISIRKHFGMHTKIPGEYSERVIKSREKADNYGRIKNQNWR